jgi:hypothetical protein
MTLTTSFAHALSSPLLDQLIVYECLHSLSVWYTVHTEDKIRCVSAFLPLLKAARDGNCGPTNLDISRRRGSVEDIKRAGFKISTSKICSHFGGDGVGGARIWFERLEL